MDSTTAPFGLGLDGALAGRGAAGATAAGSAASAGSSASPASPVGPPGSGQRQGLCADGCGRPPRPRRPRRRLRSRRNGCAASFASSCRGVWLRLVRVIWGSAESRACAAKSGLPVGVDSARCQVQGILVAAGRDSPALAWLIVLRFAPLAAVAHPSAHVALVTRLPAGSNRQLAAGSPFRWRVIWPLPRLTHDARLFGLLIHAAFRLWSAVPIDCISISCSISEAKWQSK